MLGGLGYAVDRWRGTAPWGAFGGLVLGLVVGFYELVKTVSASMKPVAWMVAASGAAWLLVTAVAGATVRIRKRCAGSPARWSSAVVSWMAYVRAHEAAPERLTRVMMTAFALKLMFFGVYVAVMMRRARPAAGAVRGEFYECVHRAVRDGGLRLRRLVMGAMRSPSRERM